MVSGLGADFLDSSGDAQYATPYKTSKTTGYVEGTVDSAWLSYLIELGIPGAALLAALFWQGITRAARSIRHASRFDPSTYSSAALLGSLLYLAIAMGTQMLGYSKTAWLPFQVLVVASSLPLARSGMPSARRPVFQNN